MAASEVSANSEWDDATGDPTQQIAVHGQYGDLIVIWQPDPTSNPVWRPNSPTMPSYTPGG